MQLMPKNHWGNPMSDEEEWYKHECEGKNICEMWGQMICTEE
jgi:hypothetical protein